MEKIKPSINDNVVDTLFITVYTRALDAKKKHPILGDKRSLELMQWIDYPFEKYSGTTTMSRIAISFLLLKEYLCISRRVL